MKLNEDIKEQEEKTNSFNEEIKECGYCKNHKESVEDMEVFKDIERELENGYISVRSEGFIKYFCNVKNKEIPDINKIPHWCPKLEDNYLINLRFETIRDLTKDIDRHRYANNFDSRLDLHVFNLNFNIDELEKLIEKKLSSL